MAKSQIAVRLPPTLMEELNSYVQRTGASKTEVIVGALAKYLDCPESIPLGQRMTEIEKKVAELEMLLKSK